MLSVDDLIVFVEQVEPGEVVDLVKQACQLFQEYQYGQYLAEIEDSLSSAQDLQLLGTEVVQILLVKLGRCADTLLNLQGFGLTDSALLSEKIEFLEALRCIAQLEDKEFVFRLIEGDTDDRDILAELIGYTSQIDKENVLPLVERIPLLFRENLKNAYGQEQESYTEQVADIQVIAGVFAKFKQSVCGEAPTFAHQLAQYTSGYGIGLEELFTLFNQSCMLNVQANQDSYKEVAKEFYGLCCISGDYYNKPLEGCRLLSVKMYPDLLMRANFEKEVRQLLLRQPS